MRQGKEEEMRMEAFWSIGKNGNPIENLPLSDNFMFGAVMTNPEMCKLFLEAALQKKISRIEFIDGEHGIANFPGLHGIRMDVYVEDEEDTRYNVEMQKTKVLRSLERRTRFYQGNIDRKFLASGEDYENLPNSYIIFVCDFDYYQKGLARYERISVIKDCPEIAYDDGAHVILFNTHYETVNVCKDIQEFLDYIRTNDNDMPMESELARMARRLVNQVRNDSEMGDKFMTLQRYLREAGKEERQKGREEGLAEGRAEGRVEGRAEGRAEGREEGLKEGICSIADVLTVSEIAKRFKTTEQFVCETLDNAGITPRKV